MLTAHFFYQSLIFPAQKWGKSQPVRTGKAMGPLWAHFTEGETDQALSHPCALDQCREPPV